MLSFVDLDRLGGASAVGDGAAGKWNSGTGFGDGLGEALGDLRPIRAGVLGAVGGLDIRPNRSGGGYEAWNNGELEKRGENDASSPKVS